MDGNSTPTKVSYLNTVCTHLVIETQDFPDSEEEEEEEKEEEKEPAPDAKPVVKRNSKSEATNTSSCGPNLLSELKVGPSLVKGTIPVGKGCIDPFTKVENQQQVKYDERLGGSYAYCNVERPFVFNGVKDLKVGDDLFFNAGFNVY